MMGADQENTDSLYPSNFDTVRLDCMSVGDKIDAENGNWTVFRYKNDYFLLINCNTQLYKRDWSFNTLNELIIFLKKA